MFRFLAILAIFFILFRVIGYFFKFFLGTNLSNRHDPRQRRYSRESNNENINIDYVPKKNQAGKDKNFEGGDYVDFEEIK